MQTPTVMQIPTDECAVTDQQIFQALNLCLPGLEQVKTSFEAHDLAQAKKHLNQP